MIKVLLLLPLLKRNIPLRDTLCLMLQLFESWRAKTAVQALMGFRGFELMAAEINVSEPGDIHRFEYPRQLMTYLGLVRTESSSGLGSISLYCS